MLTAILYVLITWLWKKVMAILATTTTRQRQWHNAIYYIILYSIYIQKKEPTKHLLQEKQNICIHTLKIKRYRHILILKERKSKNTKMVWQQLTK